MFIYIRTYRYTDMRITICTSLVECQSPNWLSSRPTVSPAKNSLVYFISIAYIDRPVLRGHGQEAKRGEAGGHRITRNCEALGAFLLTCDHRVMPARDVAPDRCNSSGSAMDACSDTPAGARRAERAANGGVVDVPRASLCRHVPHELMRNVVLNFDPCNTRNCLPPKKLRREIQ